MQVTAEKSSLSVASHGVGEPLHGRSLWCLCNQSHHSLRALPKRFRQAKDALKLPKKSLGNKNSKVQILALYVLETLKKKINKIVLALKEGLQCRGAAGM